MKLLYFLDSTIFYDEGKKKYFFRSAPGFFMKALGRYFHRIVVLSPVQKGKDPIAHGFGGSIESIGVDIVELPWGGRAAGTILKLFSHPIPFIKIIIHQIRECDLVWIKHPSFIGILVHILALFYKKKVVLQIGGNILDLWKSPKYKGWNKAFVLFLCYITHYIIRFLSLVSVNLLQGHKIHKLYNLDMKKNTEFIFSQVSKENILVRKDTCLDKQKNILFVGALCPEKGLLLLIEAIKQMKVEGHDILLHVVGQGPLKEQILDMSKPDNDSGVNIRYHGFVPFGEMLFEIYRTSDIFVLPTYYPEGFPRVIIESWASSLPVITTKTSGIDRIVIHEKTGLITEINAEAIKDSIIKIITDGVLRREMINNARQQVMKKYTSEIQAQHAINHFKKVYPLLDISLKKPALINSPI